MPGVIDGLIVVGVLLLLARAWSLAQAKGAAKSQRFSFGIMAALASVALFMIREFGLAVPVGFVAWVLLFGASSSQRSWYGLGAAPGNSGKTRNAPFSMVCRSMARPVVTVLFRYSCSVRLPDRKRASWWNR